MPPFFVKLYIKTNPTATKEEYVEKQKLYEDKIKPVMMKLYENSGSPGASSEPQSSESQSSGPQVSEVD